MTWPRCSALHVVALKGKGMGEGGVGRGEGSVFNVYLAWARLPEVSVRNQIVFIELDI